MVKTTVASSCNSRFSVAPVPPNTLSPGICEHSPQKRVSQSAVQLARKGLRYFLRRFAKEWGKRTFPLIVLFIVSLTYPSHGATGVVSTLSDEVQKCLSCHGKQGTRLMFEDGESRSAYINADSFKKSVHGSFSCSTCHTSATREHHSLKKLKSSEQYRIALSRACRKCHTDTQLKAKQIHVGLLKDEKAGKPHPCTNCHSAHGVMHTAGMRQFTNEEQYCLGCHGYAVTMAFGSGESLSVMVETASLQQSVHNKLSCSDCHYGFSSEEHPKRNFRSKRDYSVASAESCRRCHFDKYTRTLDSIHHATLSKGNLKAPVCTDCHGSHAVTEAQRERLLSAKKCRECHAATYDTFAQSVHGKALLSEQNVDVPACKDCHVAHTIRDPHTLEFHEKVPEMCANCHANKAIVGKYGLSTDVVKSYLSDFHGITLAFYKKQRESLDQPARPIAVCTDCHGIHSIISARNVDPAVLKTNLAKRCQQCHQSSPRNFPDAWLSHYEPSMKRTPLVFTINLAYKIFIPILLVGLMLQILLHIWRYAVNR